MRFNWSHTKLVGKSQITWITVVKHFLYFIAYLKCSTSLLLIVIMGIYRHPNNNSLNASIPMSLTNVDALQVP